MARRRKKAEPEANHEAWAIPYGDFLTLLLAFFVVMYAFSSINEGKYRALAESLAAAFHGEPRAMEPIQIGEHPALTPDDASVEVPIKDRGGIQPVPRMKRAASEKVDMRRPVEPGADTREEQAQSQPDLGASSKAVAAPGDIAGLEKIADEVQQAIAPLIDKDLVVVRRNQYWLEVEIKTDILFPSGVATLSTKAVPILNKLAEILKPFPNPVRIEGYTDDVPINTRRFPSNWELSAGRAASVARLMVGRGMDPHRLGIIGWSKYRPVADNSTAEGRNENRRVTLVILGGSKVPSRFYSDDEPTPDSADEASQPSPDASDDAIQTTGTHQLQGKTDAHLGGS